MFPAIRLGDRVLKKCPFKKSGPFLTGSKTTFVNGRPQVRVGDKAVPGVAVTGSKTTFVDNRPAVHLRSKVICGIILGPGSSNTFIGG
jgi:uncharacterized Zn-binding protein involved in type VI secretion